MGVGPDWASLISDWVEAGVISEDQRGPLLERLSAVELPGASGGVFGEAAVMALVMVGTLLITSSFVVSLVLLDVSATVASLLVAVVALIQGAAAVGARFAVHRAVGHGLGASAVLVWSSALLSLGIAESALEWACLVGVVLAYLLASGAALVDRARGLAGASGLALVAPWLSQFDSSTVQLLSIGLCAVYVFGLSGATVALDRLGERRLDLDVLSVQVPFFSFVAVFGVLIHRAIVFTGSNAQEWESSALLGLFGGGLLLAGWAAGSRFSLVSGLSVLLIAQAPVLFAVGDPYIGVVVLGLEGIALVCSAVVALVVGAQRASRERGPAGGA